MVVIIIDVDMGELSNNIMGLTALIDEYENIKLNLFNQLKDSCINWQDGNSVKFDNEIYLEKQESDLFLQALKSKKEIFELVYTKYHEFGNKIKCNLNNKNSLLGQIDDCYNKASNIINSFNYIDRSFYYSEIYSISLQKDVIVGVRNKLSTIKTQVVNLFNKIENIEKEVKNKINALEAIKINDFDFYLGE